MPAKKSPAVQAVGRVIREARERDCSQEAFAAHIGLNRSYYSAIERGEFNITLTTLLKVADGLGVRASSLLRRARL